MKKNCEMMKAENYFSEGKAFGTRRISQCTYVLVRPEDVPDCTYIGLRPNYDKPDNLWERFELPKYIKQVRVHRDLDLEVWPDETIRSGSLTVTLESNLAETGKWIRILNRCIIIEEDDGNVSIKKDVECFKNAIKKVEALVEQFKSDGYVKLTSDLFKEET